MKNEDEMLGVLRTIAMRLGMITGQNNKIIELMQSWQAQDLIFHEKKEKG